VMLLGFSIMSGYGKYFRQAGAWPERWVPKQEIGNQERGRPQARFFPRVLKLFRPS
jgi:hypothetical protein